MTGTLNSKTATRAMIKRSLRAARSNLRKKHGQLIAMRAEIDQLRAERDRYRDALAGRDMQTTWHNPERACSPRCGHCKPGCSPGPMAGVCGLCGACDHDYLDGKGVRGDQGVYIK